MGCALLKHLDDGDDPIFIHGDGVESCSACGVMSEYLCDFPLGNGKTCDAPLCDRHAILQGRRPSNQLMLFNVDFNTGHDDPDAVHFCPVHELIARKTCPS